MGFVTSHPDLRRVLAGLRSGNHDERGRAQGLLGAVEHTFTFQRWGRGRRGDILILVDFLSIGAHNITLRFKGRRNVV